MNPLDLLDYQLGQLAPAERARVEAALDNNPELASRCRLLGSALNRLLDDGEGPQPPPDLSARTLQFVASSRASTSRSEWAPTRVRFRAADLAVAATILLAATATLIPAVSRTRSQMVVTRCVDNLRQLGTVLGSYAFTNGHFPFHSPDAPLSRELPALAAAAHEKPSVLSCPSNQGGIVLASVRADRGIQALVNQAPAEWQPGMNHGYAFHVGYLNGQQRPGPLSLPSQDSLQIPLAADPPAIDAWCRVAEGNSHSHGGGGQNVLFNDLHVRWLRDRTTPIDQDIYLNAIKKCSYGVNDQDATLLPLAMPLED